MAKIFFAGLGFAIVIAIVLLLAHSSSLAFEVPGIIGIVSLILAGIFSGAFVSGDRMRGNYFLESPEDRKDRNSITKLVVLFGIPNLVVALFVFLFLKY